MTECKADGVSTFLQPATELKKTNSALTAEDLSYEMKGVVLPVTIFIGIEACLGIAGNIFILMIYSLRYRRCNFKYFVLCMAIIDLTSCLTTLPGEIYSQLHWYSYKYEWICKTKSYFNVFTVWSSALALLLLAYDRYRKICCPLDWQLHPSRARRLCIISITMSSVISAPVAILWGKQTYIYEQTHQNITVTICEKSGYFTDGNLPFLFITGAYMTPVACIICTIYILNFKIARAIFLSIPVPRNETFILDKRNSDCTSHQVDNTVDHDKDVHKSEVPMENNYYHINRQSDQYHYCESENTLDTIIELKPNADIQTSLNTEDHSLERHGIKERLEFDKIGRKRRYKTKWLSSCSSDTSGYISLHQLKHRRLSSSSYTSQGRSDKQQISLRYSAGKLHGAGHSEGRSSRLKHKTEIMLILTTVFTITIIINLILVSFVASAQNILRRLTENEKVFFFLFWRLYFINGLINPFLYGLMDPRFRKGLRELFFANLMLRRRSTKSQVTIV